MLTLDQLSGNVHPILHDLRATEPVVWLPALDCWLVTSYDLCVQIMRDAKTYTVDHPGFSTAQVIGPSMLSLDGATQQAHRQPFERPFRKRAVTTRFQQPVADEVERLIDGFVGDGSAELRRAYAGPIAVHAMMLALGLNHSNTPVDDVLRWYDAIVDAVTRISAGEPLNAEGQAAFDALAQSMLPTIQAQDHDSLLAQAAGAADGLTNDQIVSNAAVLLFGGIETTEGMIANAIFHLLSDKATLQSLELTPNGLAGVVEESLRLEPAASVVDRYTTCDVTLAGIELKEGDLVRVSLAAANRDPAIFENPDAFVPNRPNVLNHLTFAQGPHVCLGLHLARLEAQLALARLFQRLPKLTLTDPAAAQPTGLIFRKPPTLNAIWETK